MNIVLFTWPCCGQRHPQKDGWVAPSWGGKEWGDFSSLQARTKDKMTRDSLPYKHPYLGAGWSAHLPSQACLHLSARFSVTTSPAPLRASRSPTLLLCPLPFRLQSSLLLYDKLYHLLLFCHVPGTGLQLRLIN